MQYTAYADAVNEAATFPAAFVILKATITCPLCGHRQTEAMPTDACLHFYECIACHQVAPDGHFTAPESQVLLHKLCTTLAQNRTRHLVGPDCMCTVLPPPQVAWAEVR